MIEYTRDLKKILFFSIEEAKNNNDIFIDTKHIILALLKNNDEFKKILKTYNVLYNTFLNNIKSDNDTCSNVFSLNLKKIIDNAFYYNKKTNNIDISDVILSIIDNDNSECINVLNNLNVDLEYIYNYYKEKTNNTHDLYLSEIGVNLNKKVKDLNEKLVGREKEINRVIEILARKNKNNPILVGKAGVGKTAIVEELARRIEKKQVPLFLKNSIIVELSMASLVAGTKYRGEFEEKFNKIIKELENNSNIILFVDEIHTLVGAGGAEGAIDASNILKPFLARNKIKMIGATTIHEYKKYIEKDKALDRRFQKILIEESSEEETLNILKKIKPEYERYHNVVVNNEILKLIVCLSKKYIHDRQEPDRSIDVLDEVCAKSNVENKELIKKNKLLKLKYKINKTKNICIKNGDYEKAREIKKEEKELDLKIKKINFSNKTYISKKILKEVLEIKSNTIITELSNSKNYKIIKKHIKETVKGQDEAVDLVVDSIKNNKNNKIPISFLFHGPTGVGKTFLAYKIAKCLSYNIITLDMNEYTSSMSINKIIGSSQGYVGYDDNNTIFEELKEKPNSVILVEDINKANKKIRNLLFKIINTGYLETSKKEKIYFNNSIFIITTNEYNTSCGFIPHTSNSINENILNKVSIPVKFNSFLESDIRNIIISKTNKKIKEAIINNIITKCDYKNYGAKKIETLLKKEIKNEYILL